MKIKNLFLLFFLPISLSHAFSQPPPPMAMPGKENIALVDSIIKITEHEVFFNNYCAKKVNEYATLHKWEASKTNKILKSIKFEYYSSTIYNSYAGYSLLQLRQLIDVLRSLNKNSNNWTKIILTNDMMQNNLDVFVNAGIEGKYADE